ncbi:MAG: hypothetical protein AAF787_21430, partial [Chloroflexota bacterium]
KAVEADRERIRQEREERDAKFQQAEEARKQREAERRAQMAQSRLGDAPPEAPDDDDNARPAQREQSGDS